MAELDVVAKYGRLNGALDRAWKKDAFTYCAGRLEEIRVFRALGLQAIIQLDRQIVVGNHIGPVEKAKNKDEYGFNVWLLDQLIGPKLLSDDTIFFVCKDCQNIRSGHGIAVSAFCRLCGSQIVLPYYGSTETRDNLYRLVHGD